MDNFAAPSKQAELGTWFGKQLCFGVEVQAGHHLSETVSVSSGTSIVARVLPSRGASWAPGADKVRRDVQKPHGVSGG